MEIKALFVSADTKCVHENTGIHYTKHGVRGLKRLPVRREYFQAKYENAAQAFLFFFRHITFSWYVSSTLTFPLLFPSFMQAVTFSRASSTPTFSSLLPPSSASWPAQVSECQY